MEPDDLLCSRNARPQKALVGRAQWKINSPHPWRENEQAWKEHVYRSTGAVEVTKTTPVLFWASFESRERVYVPRH
jgi:hypothetical protein